MLAQVQYEIRRLRKLSAARAAPGEAPPALPPPARKGGHRLPGSLISPGAVIFSTREKARSRVYHIHKERCFDQMKQMIGELWAWEELVPHLIFLMHNIGFPVEELVSIDSAELEVDDRFSPD